MPSTSPGSGAVLPAEALTRLDRMEATLAQVLKILTNGPPWAPAGIDLREPRERAVAPWRHLVARRHPWRKQLYLRGRNLPVRQLLATVAVNGWSEEEAAMQLDLPVEAVKEAKLYGEQNRKLLHAEGEIERLLLARGGVVADENLPG